MDVRLNIQDGKTYNVSLPNGQPLVAGTQQFTLEAMDSPSIRSAPCWAIATLPGPWWPWTRTPSPAAPWAG